MVETKGQQRSSMPAAADQTESQKINTEPPASAQKHRTTVAVPSSSANKHRFTMMAPSAEKNRGTVAVTSAEKNR